MADDFRMKTELETIEIDGDLVRARLVKKIVNQGFVTWQETHLLTAALWYWHAPVMLDHVIDANNAHLAEMGFEPITPEDMAKIKAALPLD